jgi:hypothetical protein
VALVATLFATNKRAQQTQASIIWQKLNKRVVIRKRHAPRRSSYSSQQQIWVKYCFYGRFKR